jgi:hypothetical protein
MNVYAYVAIWRALLATAALLDIECLGSLLTRWEGRKEGRKEG